MTKKIAGLLLVALGALASCGGAAPQATQAPQKVGPRQAVPPFTFAVIGDFGTGDAEQQQIADRMCAYRGSHPYDLVVTTGDNVYDVGDPARFDAAFFQPYKCLHDAGVQFRASLGNHDIATDNGRPELDEPLFGFKNNRRNYVVREGGVRFVIVDSNNLKMDWLRRNLRAQAGDRWIVPVFHHPVYSASSGHGSTPGFRPELPRLFRKRGVDLVLNGHDHVYTVTKELRGIRYVVTGGGGARIYGCEPHDFAARCIPHHHFLYITASATQLKVSAIPDEGPPLHSFTTDGRPPAR
jgi:predicted phosphodiesterase